jgi:hypothetical protein
LKSAQKLTVLIIGGYGAFGHRLVRLLADDARLKIIVAGRSLEKARAACRIAGKAQLVPMAFDRDGNVTAQLQRIRPGLVIDAAGPYQLYGDDPYRVVEGALEAGAHYLDLADASDFVRGISAFEEPAREKDLFVLSGVSTFAALSGAVVRAIAGDLDGLHAIEGGLALSPRVPLGFSIIQGIASYAGKPVGRPRASRHHALTDARQRTIAVPGCMPLPRVAFSAVDVPDLDILPERRPELKSAWFGVATRPQVFHVLMILAAWAVRLRLLPGLSFLARPMHFVTRAFTWGDHRSGMFIGVQGLKDGRPASRRWTLIADGDVGPNIPVMAAAMTALRLADGKPPDPGARSADGAFDLADYQPWFGRFGIRTAIVEGAAADGPLYRRLLGPVWQDLPPQVRQVHDFSGERRLAGRATVSRGSGLLSRLVAWLAGFPAEGQGTPLQVTLSETAKGELWQRDFDGQRFRSAQFAGKGRNEGLLIERFGILDFGLGLVVDGERLRLVGRNWSVLGFPLPALLMPRIDAFEDVRDGRFNFHVKISVPVAGFIVAYEGWLEPVEQGEAPSSATRLPA